ncbi:hypothetical protein DXG01_008018 [Tephrocybe rancida]|nr:hypothetical protein DXG01_008018 [Tephrocybe rancida]
MEDGTTFIYTNDFDGDWTYDPTVPFGPGGKAQEWSKRIGAEEWVWGMQTRFVELGGQRLMMRSQIPITVTEPFICPALYEKYINSSTITVVDEWTLSIAMGSNLAKEMEEHYATFIGLA